MSEGLKFLGRGAAFSGENNSAFFVSGGELVLIDCPMSSFVKIHNIGAGTLAGFEAPALTVIVTHTHADHTGGISTLIHYAHYVLHCHVTVIAPSEEVKDDLAFLLGRLEGCAPGAYTLLTASGANRPWLLDVIPTRHSPELEGRCFGYRLLVDGKTVVYTGDTAVIEPFLPYLTDGVYLYSDVSRFENIVHIYVGELLEKVRGLNIRLFLMHLDDPEAIMSAAEGSGAQLAPCWGSAP
ncbi:MAG: MBL fold metallo-hydrolase [Ruminiclostridium sp.]|nr:MBL fold metallo-hydrolase [Ruminiclostridium sp.]